MFSPYDFDFLHYDALQFSPLSKGQCMGPSNYDPRSACSTMDRSATESEVVGPVYREIRGVADGFGEIHKTLDELLKRLDRVLGPGSPKGIAQSKDAPVQSACELAMTLSHFRLQTGEIAARISSIIEHLEL
jgi:hypothetical protein